MKPSFARLLGKADVLVSLTDDEVEIPQFATALRRFQLQSLDRLTPEMVEWLRERLRAIG